METTITTSANWETTHANLKQKMNIYDKWIAFEDSQAKNKTFWYYLSMTFQGVFFLPVPAILMFYFNAPLYVLCVTLTMFFANVIAGMGGAGVRVILSLFAASVIIHLIMLAIFMV